MQTEGCSSRFSAGGCHHFRRAEPRIDHRRGTTVQGAAIPIRQRRMEELEQATEGGRGWRVPGSSLPTACFRWMGSLRRLDEICELAERYQAMVMVDDSPCYRIHGKTGRVGLPNTATCMGRVDIITGTLGKALGGAIGGYTTGGRRSSRCCVSVRGPTYSQTRWLRRWWWARASP